MSASQSGVFSVQEFTDLGDPLVGGRLYTYNFGTTTQRTAYTDRAGTIPHTYTADGLGGQYIALNARGELPAPLYLSGGSYDLALKRADGSTVWTRRADPVLDIIGLGDPGTAAQIGATNPDGSPTNVQALFGSQWEHLSQARTYYVRTDGSDLNNGAANTSAGAFKTLQKAADVISKLDLNGFNVTVRVADGTYTAGVSVLAPWVGKGIVYFIGNVTNTALCVINANAVACFYGENNANFYVAGFKVTNSGGDGVYAQTGAIINVGAMDYGACSASQITVGGGGFVQLTADYTISGGGTSHLHAGSPGVIVTGVITATLVGTPAYSAYFAGAAEGTITVKDVTFTGAATGPTHLAHKNGVVDTHPAFASLPGSIPGRQATGGSLIGSQSTPFVIAPNQAASNSVRLQSYNVSTATYTDRFIVDSQPTGAGGGFGYAYVNGDNSYFSGVTHFGNTLPVALATGNDGMTTQPGLPMFVSQTSQAAANFRRNGSIGAIHNFYYGAAGAALVGSITVTASTTAFNTSSDYRLKQNIGPLLGAWDRVKAYKPSLYEFKSDPGKLVAGFIAHELAEVNPQAVTGEKDAVDAEGNPAYQGVDASKLMPDVISVIKELQARIEALEAAK